MDIRNELFIGIIATSLTALTGCQATDDVADNGPDEVVQHSAISECGGFESDVRSGGEGDEGYCDAEVLEWEYDAAAATLVLVDRRVLLNCCGDRSMTADLEDGALVVTETDAPEGGGGRCRCMCVYDFSLTLEGLAEGVIDLSLLRDVTDSESGSALLWAGAIDLSLGGGVIEIDGSAADGFCGE